MPPAPTAESVAHSNIAVVKYWGKRDVALNLPAVSSLSLTLDRFTTTTRVTWGADQDQVRLNGEPEPDGFATRALAHLDRLDSDRPRARVDTHNDFPTAAGLASSASGFAALTLAALAASGRSMDLREASVLARQGSGSACRSLWGGWVRWDRGERADGADSHGVPVADAGHWDVAMVVAVVSAQKKAVGSTAGMTRTAQTSPYYPAWVDTAEADVVEGEAAVRARDLERLGRVMESSTYKMHATMHTTDPPILYWQPATVAVLHEVAALRARGIGAWATMDAGPNVKVLCARSDADAVRDALSPLVDRVRVLGPGGPATVRLLP